VEVSGSYEELMGRLLEAYPELDSEKLEYMVAGGLLQAGLLGRLGSEQGGKE
jgi:phage gp29-like protein